MVVTWYTFFITFFMDSRWKKIGLLLGLFIVTVGIGYAIYRFFFVSSTQTSPPLAANVANNALPNAGDALPGTGINPQGPGTLVPADEQFAGSGQQGSTQFPSGSNTLEPSQSRTRTVLQTGATQISLSPSGNGSLRSYNPEDGKFYKVFPDGSTVALSDKTFYSVESVTWGNQTDKAVMTFPDGTKAIYDFAAEKQSTLPRYWDGFAFSPDDTRLVTKSVGNNPSNRFLITSDVQGGDQKIIEDLGENQDKVHVMWSQNNQTVAYSFTGAPIGQDSQAIVMVGQNHENFRNLIVDGRGFTPSWSPTGNNVIYSVWNSQNGYLPQLWFSGAQGDNINAGRTDIGIQTWGDKCAWRDEATVVCGVPVSLPEGAGIQRDRYDNGPDAIYRIDLKTGQKTNLGVPDGNVAVKEISVSEEGTAFIVDRNTGRLISFNTN